MEKPVIILGGGLWGGLLAWRLKEALPHVNFRLYEESPYLGKDTSCAFRESDCEEAMPWLRPLISQSWDQYHIRFPKFVKQVNRHYHLILADHFHQMLSKRLGPDLYLNKTLTPEFALKEGDFIIDTRNSCYYKKTGFRKCLSLHIELCEEHFQATPVIIDRTVTQKDNYRTLAYFPLTSNSLILTDTWYSDNQMIDLDEMRRSLCDAVYAKGWRINKVIKEETSISELPGSMPIVREEGRVLSLAGLAHDATGCSMGAATALIDQMMQTSFRFGELKRVVKAFREEVEPQRRYFQDLNRELIEEKYPHSFEAIYSGPHPVLERFFQAKLTYLDRALIGFNKSRRMIEGSVEVLDSLFKFRQG